MARRKSAPENTVSKPAPYGYRWHGETLAPDESEARVRKLMYESFLRHRRKKTVARLLNEAGFRTRSGAAFSDTAVDRILRDGSAKGVFSHNRNGKMIQIEIEPLVSAEIWDEANRILSGSQKFGKKAVQLFAGLVFCGECDAGEKMRVPSNSPKYVCPGCRLKIGTADLEEIFRSRLTDFPLDAFQETANRSERSNDGSGTEQTIADLWLDLNGEEKGELVEGLLGSITVKKREILIRFACARASRKTLAFGQQRDFSATGQQTAEEKFPVVKTKPAIDHGSPAQTRSGVDLPQLILTEPLLNETEAARFLGVSRITLIRKRTAGEIKFFRVGFRVLYSKEKHLVPYLASCEK
jgi:hypothetical protein